MSSKRGRAAATLSKRSRAASKLQCLGKAVLAGGGGYKHVRQPKAYTAQPLYHTRTLPGAALQQGLRGIAAWASTELRDKKDVKPTDLRCRRCAGVGRHCTGTGSGRCGPKGDVRCRCPPPGASKGEA